MNSSKPITLALDVMGGDQAPDMVLRGANMACLQYPQVTFALFGPQALLESKLKRYKQLKKRSTIHDAEDSVPSDMKPSIALRQGRQSSMRLAINSVKDGTCDGVVSAGNTGALMGMSKFVLGTLEGIHRPAIASYLPTGRGESVMLDLGANIECDVHNLVEFALMGQVFARRVFGWRKPTVGLLNVGSEHIKGRASLQATADILSDISQNADTFEYYGFIEGHDIAEGVTDVVVTDGFTGNVALKTVEGTAKLYTKFLKHFLRSSWMARIGYFIARSAFHRLRNRVDPRRYNGAVFLGLTKPVVKSHGGTDAVGFSTAIGVAVDMIVHDFASGIQTELKCHLDMNDNLPAAAKNPKTVAKSNSKNQDVNLGNETSKKKDNQSDLSLVNSADPIPADAA